MNNDLVQHIDNALIIAKEAHKGQTDRAGIDYVEGHVLTVAHRSARHGPLAVICAILHDVIEDSNVTANDLVEAGIPTEVVDAVVAITKVRYEPYSVYIERVKQNAIARVVKIEDIMHNMDLGRLGGNITAKDHTRCAKYANALRYLLTNETTYPL
jgi:(p)ppGpp synthase/HD superfamily hydrolase